MTLTTTLKTILITTVIKKDNGGLMVITNPTQRIGTAITLIIDLTIQHLIIITVTIIDHRDNLNIIILVFKTIHTIKIKHYKRSKSQRL